MEDKRVKIDIWGCCVSRDIFGFFKDAGYDINVYTGGCSAVSQFQKDLPNRHPGIEIEDFPHARNFVKKTIRRDFNKSVFDDLKGSKSDWLIVDLRAVTYALYRFDFEDGTSEIASLHNTSNYNLLCAALDKRGVKYTVTELSLGSFDYMDYIDKAADIVRERYGRNVILIEARESLEHVTAEGEVEKWSYESRKTIALEYEINNRFIERSGCYFIKCPLDIISNDLHIWGICKVHYVNEFYNYAKSMVDYITSTPEPDYRFMDMEYMRVSQQLNLIRIDEQRVAKNPEMRVGTLLRRGKVEEAVGIMENLRNNGDPMGNVLLSNLYYKGKHVEKDVEKAKSLLEEVLDSEVIAVKKAYFDILWDEENPELDTKLLDLVDDYTEPEMEARRGMMYLEGRGVEKDLKKAKLCFKNSLNENVDWVLSYYVPLLKGDDDEKDRKDAMEKLKTAAETGDGNALISLAKIYQQGMVEKKDLNLAADYCRMARDLGKPPSNAPKILASVLWEIKSPETDEELVKLCKSMGDSNRGLYNLYLSKAYNQGRGVEKDRDIAMAYARKAVEGGAAGARMELVKQLQSTNDPELCREAVEHLEILHESGRKEASDRLGKAYFEGKGVEKDLEKAKAYFMEARNRGKADSGKDLLGF